MEGAELFAIDFEEATGRGRFCDFETAIDEVLGESACAEEGWIGKGFSNGVGVSPRREGAAEVKGFCVGRAVNIALVAGARGVGVDFIE